MLKSATKSLENQTHFMLYLKKAFQSLDFVISCDIEEGISNQYFKCYKESLLKQFSSSYENRNTYDHITSHWL